MAAHVGQTELRNVARSAQVDLSNREQGRQYLKDRAKEQFDSEKLQNVLQFFLGPAFGSGQRFINSLKYASQFVVPVPFVEALFFDGHIGIPAQAQRQVGHF